MIIIEDINYTLNEIIGKFFEVNRICDRVASVLNVDFGLKITSKLIHLQVAHPIIGDKFADKIADYQGERGNDTIYPATFIGDKKYETPMYAIKDCLYAIENVYAVIEDAIDLSSDRGDHSTEKLLKEILFDLIPYVDKLNSLIKIFEGCSTSMQYYMADMVVEEYFE